VNFGGIAVARVIYASARGGWLSSDGEEDVDMDMNDDDDDGRRSFSSIATAPHRSRCTHFPWSFECKVDTTPVSIVFAETEVVPRLEVGR
jgi:hypothetical protein